MKFDAPLHLWCPHCSAEVRALSRQRPMRYRELKNGDSIRQDMFYVRMTCCRAIMECDSECRILAGPPIK